MCELTIEEFVEARLKDMELMFEPLPEGWVLVEPFVVFARQVIEYHKQWPVLVQKNPELDFNYWDPESNFQRIHAKLSQEMAFLTQEEYRKRFGKEPPTAPLMRKLASKWRDHPDFQEEWSD